MALIEISTLKHHPINEEIYSLSNIDELAKSIQEVGLLEKLIVNADFEIISGNRRFEALKRLNFEFVEVEIKELSKDDEILYLISYNKQRVKTKRELLNEIKHLSNIWRQKTGRKSKDEMSSNIGTRKTRDKISKELDVSTGNISKLIFIEKTETSFIELIDKDEISINQAYLQCVRINADKQIKKNTTDKSNNNHKDKIDIDYKIFHKSSHSLNEIDDETIQLIFTSPPYWNKRKYTSKNIEIGSEKTPDEYIENLVSHLLDCHRVLKKEGSFYLNLGDTYIDKSLQNIPHRVIIELLKNNWILRNTIIWKKKNYLPQSNKDSLTPSYEFIFHLVKSKHYYYNQIKTPTKSENGKKVKPSIYHREVEEKKLIRKTFTPYFANELKNLNDFWTDDILETATFNQVSLKKLNISIGHPAAFPIDIIILPILQTTQENDIVLDPFSGSGSVGECALKSQRQYIGYEINRNFIELQNKRLQQIISKKNI